MITQWFNRYHPLVKLEKKRQKLVLSLSDSDVYFPLCTRSLPKPDTLIKDIDFVVIDLETTGLDSQNDQILSVGMVNIEQMILSLSTAQHYYLADSGEVKSDSAVINHIVPEVLVDGVTRQALIDLIIKGLSNRVIVVHGASIERHFLDKLFNVPEGVELPIIWIDTLTLEKSLMSNRGHINQDYRLSKIRERKKLPPYLAHNAFADVVATGELLLVLIQEIFQCDTQTIGALYNRSIGRY